MSITKSGFLCVGCAVGVAAFCASSSAALIHPAAGQAQLPASASGHLEVPLPQYGDPGDDPWDPGGGDPGDPGGGDPGDPGGGDPGDPGGGWDDSDYQDFLDNQAPDDFNDWGQGDYGDEYDQYLEEGGASYSESETVVEDGVLIHDIVRSYVVGDDGYVYVTVVEDGTYQGTYRYPVPEPTALALFFFGLPAVFSFFNANRRRHNAIQG